VDSVLGRIERAAGYGGLRVKVTLVNNTDVNAGATPGGYLLVNAGLLALLERLAQKASPNDLAAQKERFIGYVAAILSHEVAHITLGHTDSLMSRLVALTAVTLRYANE
jgi:predicted Zn-dependent protease